MRLNTAARGARAKVARPRPARAGPAPCRAFLAGRAGLMLALLSGPIALLTGPFAVLSGPTARAAGGPEPAETPGPRVRIVTTTTMIGAAVADLAGDWTEITVLTPPSACPGQIDVGPKQVEALHHADLILRHDYEIFLDQRLRALEIDPKRFMLVGTTGQQNLPDGYVSLCAQVSEILSARFPDHAVTVRRQQAEVARRVRLLGRREGARVHDHLKGKQLVVATFQTGFVGWAGGAVAGTFDQGDDMSLDRVKDLMTTAVEQHVIWVVGNLQWGDRALRSLSESLGVPGVNLSGYPASAEPGAFDRLLTGNVDQLISLTKGN